MLLRNDGGCDRLKGLALLNVQAIEEPCKLPACEQYRSAACRRPSEPAALKALVEQPEAIDVPVKQLDAVSSTTAENENGWCERVELHLVLSYGSESVDGLAHIGRPSCQPNPVCNQVDHRGARATAANTPASSVEFTPGETSTIQGASSMRIRIPTAPEPGSVFPPAETICTGTSETCAAPLFVFVVTCCCAAEVLRQR